MRWRSRPPRPLQAIGKRLVILFGVTLTLGVIDAVLAVLQAAELADDDLAGFVGYADGRAVVLGLQTLIILSTLPVLVAWSVRAARNLHRTGASRPLTAPWLAGLGWLLPLAMIPLQMVFLHRMWQRSDPAPSRVPGTTGTGSPAIFTWLGLMAGAQLTGFVAQGRRPACDTFGRCDPWTLSLARSANPWDLVAALLVIATAVAGIVVVQGLSRRQDARTLRWMDDPSCVITPPLPPAAPAWVPAAPRAATNPAAGWAPAAPTTTLAVAPGGPADRTPVAGWYPDPAGSLQPRWWNGRRWTEHLAPWGPEPPAGGPPNGTATVAPRAGRGTGP